LGILVAFTPFIVFAILDRLIGSTGALAAGALISAALLVRDWMALGRAPKILKIGTVLLFGGLALCALLGGPTWSVVRVRRRTSGPGV
jgi:hypothetical protein